MRISNLQNSVAFGKLYVTSNKPWYINQSVINKSKDQLADTKFIDLIIDYFDIFY